MDSDTQIGGPGGNFPETRESAILGTRSVDAARRNLSYEAIVSAYWKPVYRYIRVKWRIPNEDAKDLTQSFFTQVIDKNFVAAYEPAKASFRTYLRTCLDRFLANQHKHEGRLKRCAPMVQLDEEIALEGSEQNLDDYFQQEWTRAMFARAVETLRERLTERGKEVYFEVFNQYDLAECRPTYDELAAALNLTPVNVTNYLAGARREFRAIVFDELRAITSDERDLQREALALLG